jgi:sentrin-specific protease 8
METKFREIMERCDRAIVGSEQTRLGAGMKNLVINWSALCKIVLNGIMESHHMLEELDKLRCLLEQILIYQVDATSSGLFVHEPLPPEPRREVWQPIDDEYIDGGKADSAVPNFDAPPPLPAPRHIAKRGVKRGISQMNQTEEKMVRKGLRGGGAGGLPDVPHWFASWNQEKEDKDQCDMLVAGARDIGLTITEVGPLLLSKNTEKKGGQGGEEMNKTPNSDVVDLRNNSFLSDTVISEFFSRLSSRFDNEEVLLVDAASAVAYAQDPTSIRPEHLRDRRIVVLPVNNAAEFGRPDLGSHWSVLVIDATSEGSTRFIHHDSLGGLNLAAAQHLAARMRTVFPDAQEVENVQTPRQQTGYDCAVYVMAIARSITRWWRRRAFEGDWMDRMWNEVTAESVHTLRQEFAELLEREQLEKETKKVECKKDKAED